MISEPLSTRALNIPPKLPLLPVRDIVVFPHMVLPLAVGREKSIKALEGAMAGHHMVFLAAQKRVQTEDPQKEDVFPIGTIAEILQLLKMPDGTLKILVEGHARGRMHEFYPSGPQGFVEVDVEKLEEKIAVTPEIQALMRQCQQLFEHYVRLN